MQELGGSTARQPGWPVAILQTINVMLSLGMGLARGRRLSAFWFSGSLNCSVTSAFLIKFVKIQGGQSSGGEKNCIVYSLFCLFIIIIVFIIINSSSISFVVLLNCLYVNL